MRYCLPVIFLFCQSSLLFAQTVEETHPKTIWVENDTFALRYDDYPERDTFIVSRKDKQSPGMDARMNVYAVLYFNKDSLRLNYNNRIPYQHNFYVNFESPKGKTTLRFHFNEVVAYFPPAYVEQHSGKIHFDIPEQYELANIIWTLSPSGKRAKDLNKKGAYYERMVKHFKPFLNHPVFKKLDFPDSIYASRYYDFRENSFPFNFKDAGASTKLLFNGPLYYAYGNQLADSSLFGVLKPLVEDFAAKSGFRKFYAANRAFYQSQIKRQEELLPVQKMWTWLEQQFPRTKINTYSIVFSPLIGGSHSTQIYWAHTGVAWYSHAVMFVCGADRVDSVATYTEKQKEGLMSGIVFTEIDHNYVNPATNRYARTVDSIFTNRKIWTRQDIHTDFYGSPVSVFNEYMTHAVFCLFVRDSYDSTTADFIIAAREKLMVERRNFTRFREFNTELQRLRDANRNLKVSELYPQIITWCRQQQL